MNTILTADKILLKALDVLHQKCNFISTIHRGYDDQFGQTGAQIGQTLRIRLPEKFSVTSGAVMDTQDSTEQYVTLSNSTRKHVAMNFTDTELSLSMDEFNSRKITPAMSVLASVVEADALNMVLDIYNSTGLPVAGAASGGDELIMYLQAKAKMNQNLAPKNDRMALIDSVTSGNLVDALKALPESNREIASQYVDGIMGRAAGFVFAENDLLPTLTCGTRTGTITVDGAAPTGSTIDMKAIGSGLNFKAGEVFTIAGYYAVHPETKAPLSHLMQFVITEDKAATGTAIADLGISPAIVTSGAYQNVYGTPGTDAAITICGSATADDTDAVAYGQNICYQKNTFAFATADLLIPKSAEFASRQMLDGISMTIVKDYNINNATYPCRVDIHYGYVTLQPETGCRVWR